MSNQHRTARIASGPASRRLKRSGLMLSAAVAALALYTPAHAQVTSTTLPTGGTVVAGSATIGTPTPSAMTVNQSTDRAVINWNSFDIGSGASVAFTQPSNTSIAVNRVVSGAAPSEIAGTLTANGIVAVLNPNGVLFSGTANVDVGGMIASTGDIDQAAFMAGGATLTIGGATSGEIVIRAGADISIANSGLGAFVAPTVRNNGVITATGGRVQLGAGTTFTLDLAGDGLLQIGIGADSPLIENFGDIAGRRIEMTARQASAVVDQTIRTGVLPVGSARVDGNAIVLDAAGADFAVSAEIAGRGNLTVNANRISGAADINVDGNLTLNVNSQGAVADTTAGAANWINDALGVIGSQVDATTINLGAGLYRSGTVINNSNVTIDGHGAARIGWTSGIENAIDVWGDNVTLRNLEIFGPATSGFTSFAWGSTNSRGIFVNRFADNVSVLDNNIHDIRTGVIVDGRNLNAVISGNRIDNTKSGISVQYTNGGDASSSGLAGSSITLAGNYEGSLGNEWGINVHLNGIWNGVSNASPTASTSPVGGLPVGILGTASLAEQARLVALGAANNGMSVQNIAYSAANRTRAYVTTTGAANTQGSALSPLASLQAGVNALVTGGTLFVANGNYSLGNASLKILRGLSLIGASQAGVVIDGRSASGEGRGTIEVLADNVSLSGFTLYGSETTLGNYGIKVQPNPVGHVNTPGGDDQRLRNFAVSDVTVRGSRRAELDLNGVDGATITNFTANGLRVANNAATEGAGIQISDSLNVTLTGVHTLGNNWGGVALYQSNGASGYDAQTTNITIDAVLNSFEEANGLFAQRSSTTQDFGTLNLAGFGYAVRNTGHRPDGNQFTFFRTDLADATGFALALGGSTSSIETYAGDHFGNVFTVASGLTIASAMRDLRAGGTVNVAAGTFNEAVSITRSMTLAGAGIDATSITGGIAITSGFTGLTLRDFAVSGSAAGGAVINNSGTLTNLTVDGVRIDGEGVADRHGLIGGQIGGDIAITDSEFRNIRGWAAFDTRSGAGGNDGAQIASALFADNLIDNSIGHINFRQQIGAATLPDVTISGNTVTNTGSATNSFGAVFKAFNADTIDFIGNNVSGVGTSGFNPAGEAAYGAVLMTRGAAALNVTDNVFTGNNQVLAIEPGRGLSTATTLTGNSFVNNAYSIYLPANLAGAGTIAFGAGNDFVAGASTVQHIVWRSGAALDLTNVAFDGALVSEMSAAGRFAVADLITDGIDRAGAGMARLVAGELYVTTAAGADAALRALAFAGTGDTINLSAGTHTLSNTLFITQNGVSVLGQGSGATTINASGHNNWGIRVPGNDVMLGGFALIGSSAAVGNANYGVKVEATGDVNGRNTGFEIHDVAISGTRRTGLDLNSVVGALVDGVSVTGVTNGNGIAIVDSANVTVRNSATTGNAWGGLALYQTNNIAGGGRNQQLTGIAIEANNAFGETTGLYLQDSSTLFDPGVLTLGGYNYAVRNFAHRSDGSQFVFFQKDLAAATGHALALGTPSSSSIEGYSGDHYSNVFTVVDGLAITAAARDVRAGGAINVGAGTYASGTVIAANGVTLSGEAGAKIDATHNGDNGITISGDGVTVQGFEIFGAADQPFNLYDWGSSITRGVVVANGADNATVTGNTIHDVRNGVLIDGRNAGAAITGNTIDNSKSAISVQYTDGSNIDISGNAEGANGNEWGVIAHLNGIWNGSTITASGGALGTATPLGEQQRLMDLSAANNGMAVFNQAWSAANRTRAYVTTAGTAGAQGSLLTPSSLQAGLDAVVTGGTVHIAAGSYNEDVVLNGLRVLDMGAISVSSLIFGAGAAGTNIGTSVTATGAIDLASGILLSGDTALTGNEITLGAIMSRNALTLTGGTLAIGPASLASLGATGSRITTAGVTTAGAQSYTGATTLAGDYSTGGAAFLVDGAATLAGDTGIATNGGNASLGATGGAHSLVVDAGSGSVALGTVDGLASLSATGTAIATAGAQTSGAQHYAGATSLSGAYGTAGGGFTVDGATALAGATTVATGGGNASFGTVSGAQTLSVDAAAGNVGLGAVSGLTALSASGVAIDTAGAASTGHQRYTGATTLRGSYTTAGGDLTIAGAASLGGATNVATNGGDAALGVVTGGGNALALDAGSGTVSLGAASGLASLNAIGASIATVGVATSGAQSYAGATSLSGAYTTGGGAFAIDGATTTVNAVSVGTAGGHANFGSVGGAGGLSVNAGSGNVGLGAVSGVASLTAIGANIVTAGATTIGAQSYTGATTLGGAYAAGGSFAIDGATMLAATTSVTAAGGNIVFGAIGAAPGAGGLTIDAGTGSLSLGAVDSLASLSATGAAITTAGVSTSGTQHYTGATTFNGTYASGGSFTVDGAATVAGATSVMTEGDASFGTITGAGALAIDAGANALALGALDGLASLSVAAAAITTAGANTSGVQHYTGATALNGAYSASGFTVDGQTTLSGDTAITTDDGDVSFGAIGGAKALGIDAGAGDVALGAIVGIASLSASGSNIFTAGAATNGAQSYSGAVTLAGDYSTGGGSFAVDGATTALGAVSIVTAGGDATLGAVGGAGDLTIDAASGDVALGAVSGLARLAATGATISTAGAVTTGDQSYIGATTLSGSYTSGGGDLTIAGATILGSATAVATNGGDAALGTVTGGGNAFAVDAGGGAVSLGAATGLASFAATGTSIATSGVATSGAQSYVGATTLSGNYVTGGGSFAVNGATTTTNSVSVTTSGGDASFGSVGGAGGLSVDAAAGNISLGAVNGLASLSATAATIATAGATTGGGQSYTGATTLNGTYATHGGGFTVTGATMLGGATSVRTSNGALALGVVNGAIAGGQSLALDAGGGSIMLGALGTQSRLGAVTIDAGETVLGGATYAANSLGFTGGAGASVRLTQGTTTFNTTLPGGAGGAISIAPNLIGTVNNQQNVTFVAGNGLTFDSGDVTIGNAGTDAIRLGSMSVTANDFSAQTVKLANDFTSVLSGSQLFSANTLDTLGSVSAKVAGAESGPIRAGGAVAIDAGSSGTGSIIAGGPVSLGYASDVGRAITSTSAVSVATTGSIAGAINAGASVSLATTTGTISSTVTATGPVSAQTTSGAITAAISSNNAVALGTGTGTIGGSVQAAGAVSASSAGGTISSAITSNGGVTLGTTTGSITSTVQASGPVSATTTGGAISGAITSSGAVTLATTSGSIAGTVQAAGPVSANAASGSVTAAIRSDAGVTVGSTSGSVGGSIQAGGAVDVAAGGAVSAAVTTSGNASLTSANGGVSSTVNAGGAVAVTAPGPVTSTITAGSTIAVTSNTPLNVQVNGGSVTVNAPGGTVTGVFKEIVTDDKGSFIVNDEPVIGSGKTDARQIIIDSFLRPAGSMLYADGSFELPLGLALGLIAPAGDGSGKARPPVVVNSVGRLGELLRQGYTAIIIQLDETNLELEEELAAAAE